MATPSDTANEGKIRDHGRWNEGDAVLVSSDNVRFRVPSYHLLAASVVLRNAPKLTGPIELHLSDQETEDAHTVNNFLLFIVDHKLPNVGQVEDPSDPDWCSENLNAALKLRDLIRLLKKFECDAFLLTLGERLEVDSYVQGARCRFSAIGVFLAGIEFENLNLCALALGRRFTAISESYDTSSENLQDAYPLPGYHALNPSGMSIELYSCIPASYMLALIRAWAGEKNNADVRHKFRKHFDSIIEYRQERLPKSNS